MCGIAGFIHFERDNGRPEWAAIAHSMGETLHHRGPDGGSGPAPPGRWSTGGWRSSTRTGADSP